VALEVPEEVGGEGALVRLVKPPQAPEPLGARRGTRRVLQPEGAVEV